MRAHPWVLFIRALPALAAALLAGCANTPLPEVDWADYRADPQAHAGQRTLIRVDLATVNADPRAFSGKELILHGTVSKVSWTQAQPSGSGDWFRWYLNLTDATGQTVRCYEHTYRTEAWDQVTWLTHRAFEQGGPFTAVGRYRPGYGLELDWIVYAGTNLDTDYLPPRARILLP